MIIIGKEFRITNWEKEVWVSAYRVPVYNLQGFGFGQAGWMEFKYKNAKCKIVEALRAGFSLLADNRL